jgi:hypothetical protein
MSGFAGRILGSSYAKIVFAALLLLGGVAGGIYIGDGMTHRRTPKTAVPEELAPDLTLGDVFPLMEYKTLDGTIGNFEQLIMGHRTVVLFLSGDCGRCEDLLNLWNLKVAPVLDSGVKVVTCFRHNEIPASVTRMLGSKLAVIPEEQLYHVVGLKITPTIAGLDEYGLVTYLQAGYSDAFGKDFYEHFAMGAK